MRKLLLSVALLATMALSAGLTFADDDEKKGEDNKSKKGKFGGKFDATKLFEKMNPDKDGKVSKEDFEKVFENLGQPLLTGIAGKLFDRLDTDKDGKLTKEEFSKFGEGLGEKGDAREKLKGLLDKVRRKKKDQ